MTTLRCLRCSAPLPVPEKVEADTIVVCREFPLLLGDFCTCQDGKVYDDCAFHLNTGEPNGPSPRDNLRCNAKHLIRNGNLLLVTARATWCQDCSRHDTPCPQHYACWNCDHAWSKHSPDEGVGCCSCCDECTGFSPGPPPSQPPEPSSNDEGQR